MGFGSETYRKARKGALGPHWRQELLSPFLGSFWTPECQAPLSQVVSRSLQVVGPPTAPAFAVGGAAPPWHPWHSAFEKSGFGLHGPRTPEGPRTRTCLRAIWAPSGCPTDQKSKMVPNLSQNGHVGYAGIDSDPDSVQTVS